MGHNKRLPAPRHYPISRKEGKYVSTIEGSRSEDDAVPVVLVLRDVLGYAENYSEAAEIVENGDILRNGEELRDVRQGTGVLDVIEIPETGEAYRIIRQGRDLEFVPVTDSDKVVTKITGKDSSGDQYAYRLHNGENYLSDEDYSTGNTLVFNSGVKEIELEEGSAVLVIDGRHAGEIAELKEIREQGMDADTGLVESGQEFETKLENLVAIDNVQLGDR